MIALFLVDKGWGFLSVNKPAVVVWQSATMTAGKTFAGTGNSRSDGLNAALRGSRSKRNPLIGYEVLRWEGRKLRNPAWA